MACGTFQAEGSHVTKYGGGTIIGRKWTTVRTRAKSSLYEACMRWTNQPIHESGEKYDGRTERMSHCSSHMNERAGRVFSLNTSTVTHKHGEG